MQNRNRAKYWLAVTVSAFRWSFEILRAYWILGRLTSAEHANEVMDVAPDGEKLRALQYEIQKIRELRA